MDEDEGVVLMHACHGAFSSSFLSFLLMLTSWNYNTHLVLVFIIIHGVQCTYFALYRLDGHELIDSSAYDL